MFRPLRCKPAPAPLFRATQQSGRRAVQQTRRYASTNASGSSPQAKRSPAVWLGLLGGGGIVGAYFFWPDESRSAPTYSNAALSPTHFTPVTVTSTEYCSDASTKLITLTVPPQSLPPLKHQIGFSPVWSIFVKDDDIQVERPYTPLEGIDENGQMKFWIKKYPKGEVGRWLHTKNVGDKIEIRGPLKTWPWREDAWDEVIMISGGTGITPFYQLIHATLLSQPDNSSKTRFTLLHSSRTPEELPPPEILQPLITSAQSFPERLNVSLFVDTLDGSESRIVPLAELHEGRIGKLAIEQAVFGKEPQNISWWQRIFGAASPSPRIVHKERKILFLVCGPEPMLNAISGPYGRNYSQGPVGGALKELGCQSEQVWKL